LTARRLQNAEQGRPSSGGARLRHNFASDNSVVNPIDVHVTCDDSQNVIIAGIINISNIRNEDFKKSSSGSDKYYMGRKKQPLSTCELFLFGGVLWEDSLYIV
jgi:hypothetical protein